MNGWIVISTAVSAASMVAIVIYTIKSHRLVSGIQERDAEYKQQITDLYQAMVICGLFSGDPRTIGEGDMPKKISFFKQYYKGKTEIFPNVK